MTMQTDYWVIAAFSVPDASKSVLYRQPKNLEQLLKAVTDATHRGANVLSIRAVQHKVEEAATR